MRDSEVQKERSGQHRVEPHLEAAVVRWKVLARVKTRQKPRTDMQSTQLNTISPYNRNKIYGMRGLTEDAVSTMSSVMSVIRNQKKILLFALHRDEECANEWPTYSIFNVSYYCYCTMFSLQICFLLSGKSISRNPPPGPALHSEVRGLRALFQYYEGVETNVYTCALQEILNQQFLQYNIYYSRL